MLSRFLAANCVGFDDTRVTLITPKETPSFEPGKTDLPTQRLIETMNEARKKGKESLAAKLRCEFSQTKRTISALKISFWSSFILFSGILFAVEPYRDK